MKLLIVSDLHYSLPQLDWLMGAAPGYDLVVVAGDLLDAFSSVDPGAQVVVIRKYLKRLSAMVPILVCSGNHDLDEMGSDGEKHAGWLNSVRGLTVTTDGGGSNLAGDVTVTVCPWWDGPDSREAIGKQLAAAAEQHGSSWVWVYHAPPANSPISWGGHRYFGDAALSDWIAQYRPDLVFCGHVHEAPFVRGGSWVDRIGDTWVFNGGRQIGPIPTHIALDTVAAEAAWFSFEGAEIVKLAEPLTRPVTALTEMPAWMARR